jgi:hypothetical protein
LDQRLKAHIDQSAQVVTAGRRDLDAVRKWCWTLQPAFPKTPQANGQLRKVAASGHMW